MYEKVEQADSTVAFDRKIVVVATHLPSRVPIGRKEYCV